jgi:hypothetical protein
MCTVTFLPLKNANFILTSNRDEQKERETLAPKKYVEDGVEMIYPKDKIAGGTWIGASKNNRLVCVLNGAFIRHKRKSSYKVSRGIVSKDILKTKNLSRFVPMLDLMEVEPFTMIIVDWNDSELSLFELIWDGEQKHFTKLENKAKIWSSSTLYENDIVRKRQKLFQNWLVRHEWTAENILEFHHSTDGDREQAILMRRSYIETVSVTSVQKENNRVIMNYEDVLQAHKTTLHS